MNDLQIRMQPPEALQVNGRNARKHSKAQVRKLADSIKQFGFLNPVLVDDSGKILAGHGRIEAAKLLKLTGVPTLCISHLSKEQQRAFIIADNKLATMSSWNHEVLGIELDELTKLDFDIKVTGFDVDDIDNLIEPPRKKRRWERDDEDKFPELCEAVVSQTGDAWLLGEHRLRCGDPRDAAQIDELMGNKLADVLFTVPPRRLTRSDPRIAMAKCPSILKEVSEMTPHDFRDFLRATVGNAQASVQDGALVYMGSDWRDYVDVLAAGQDLFGEPRDLCVWNSEQPTSGVLYASAHELFPVFSNGEQRQHLKKRGKRTGQRSNVWTYETGGHSRRAKLPDMPLIQLLAKPVALVADVLSETTEPRGIVVDVFGGLGSTLIAAQKTGRAARIIECDPHFCDLIIRRYQAYTGDVARLGTTSETFTAVEQARISSRTNSAALN